MYVSAYEASLQRSTNKLSSVVNMSVDYRGGNNTEGYDGTYRTLLGRPVTRLGLQTLREYARNRKPNTSEWNCYVYDIHKTILWLFAVEYATLNTQKEFNESKDNDGFSQGGLGNGVTTVSLENWRNYNGNNPFIPCGHSDVFGNNTGIIQHNAFWHDGYLMVKSNVPRYRGIENPFGHIWKWVDGVKIKVSQSGLNDGDELSKAFVCLNPAFFSDDSYDGYEFVGNESRSNGYIKKIIFGNNGEMIPLEIGAGSTSYFCDCNYVDIGNPKVDRSVLIGGASDVGACSGLFSKSSNYTHTDTSENFGTRLCFIPQH